MSSSIQLFFDGSWITLILSSCLLLMILTFAIQRGQFIYAVRNIPQPISLPLIGNAYQLNSTLEEFFNNLVKWSQRFAFTK
ncbi:hypothetical protein HZH66_015099 [Vespula vulgaris]|uniref:Cytochrome P450 n=1 Tax=Vespula vulgaris TaxID=7454 RepID=A0A834IYK9_VESVU|nr:hypothetical protein HZH66_015099 [Vespula vulgaris]